MKDIVAEYKLIVYSDGSIETTLLSEVDKDTKELTKMTTEVLSKTGEILSLTREILGKVSDNKEETEEINETEETERETEENNGETEGKVEDITKDNGDSTKDEQKSLSKEEEIKDKKDCLTGLKQEEAQEDIKTDEKESIKATTKKENNKDLGISLLTIRTGQMINLMKILRDDYRQSLTGKTRMTSALRIEKTKQAINKVAELYRTDYTSVLHLLIHEFRTHDNEFMTLEYLSFEIYRYIVSKDDTKLRAVMLNSVNQFKNKRDFMAINYLFDNGIDIGIADYNYELAKVRQSKTKNKLIDDI